MKEQDDRLLGPWVFQDDMILCDNQCLLDCENHAIARVFYEEAGSLIAAAPRLLIACKAARVALEERKEAKGTLVLLDYVINLAEEE